MKLYTMMPLMSDRIDELCDDIAYQYKHGIADEALFIMNLQPEGDPVADKATNFCKTYDKFSEKLASRGLKCGILAQATIGHGATLTQKPKMQHLVSLLDGKESHTICPYDENFRSYIESTMATLTERNPSTLMVDDDFRLFARKAKGCVCPRHLQEIGKRIGRSIGREELLAAINKPGEEAQRILDAFYDTQIDALIGAAKAMRRGIDSVNPEQQGAFCVCGSTCEGAREIAAILAGEGNPVIVRVNNSKYTSAGARGISTVISRAATQINALDGAVDYFLAETDTCPHNRYSTSASSLHTHFTASILEGIKGCKHWITKTNNYEPQSNYAYREKLSRYAGYYKALSEIAPTVEWQGAKIPLPNGPVRPTAPLSEFKTPSEDIAWASCVLERLGIPMYFAKGENGAIFFDGNADEYFSEGEILKMLSGRVFLSSVSAKRLIDRGLGKYLGVELSDIQPNDKPPRYEVYGNGQRGAVQRSLKKLIPIDDVKVLSEVYTVIDGTVHAPYFPAVTAYNNRLGGKVTVFAGSPNTPFTYSEAFSYLCYARKQQLIELLRECDTLPVYYPGDAEVYVKAGKMKDGSTFCAFFNIGLDNLDRVTLVADRPVSEIMMLSQKGVFKPVKYTVADDGVITVRARAEILNPVILKII